MKKKEEREQKKKVCLLHGSANNTNPLVVQLEAKHTADVFEEFVASFEESDSSSKTFVRGSTSIKPAATGNWLATVAVSTTVWIAHDYNNLSSNDWHQ